MVSIITRLADELGHALQMLRSNAAVASINPSMDRNSTAAASTKAQPGQSHQRVLVECGTYAKNMTTCLHHHPS